jgi:hypothetical protein
VVLGDGVAILLFQTVPVDGEMIGTSHRTLRLWRKRLGWKLLDGKKHADKKFMVREESKSFGNLFGARGGRRISMDYLEA